MKKLKPHLLKIPWAITFPVIRYSEVVAGLLKGWIDNFALKLSDSALFLIDAIEYRTRIQPDSDAMHFLFGKFDIVMSILQQLIEYMIHLRIQS